MASKEDARPFTDLQKDADEFQAKFEEDIKKCKSFLNSKITALICEPESFGNLVGPDQNPLMQFSKAKYAVFISVKNLMNDYEKQWIKYLNEMKKLFLENVEIFLAGTKLEVKLPPSDMLYVGSKKSPVNKRESSITSSIYPILNSISQSLPVLSSPLRSKEVQSTKPKETESVSPLHKSASWKMEIDDIELDLNTSRSSNRSRRSFKVDSSDLNVSHSSPREKVEQTRIINSSNPTVLPTQNFSSEEEEKSSTLVSQGRAGKRQSTAQRRKQKTNGIMPKNVSSSESQEETSEVESAMNSRHLSKGRKLQNKKATLNQEKDIEKNKILHEDIEETNRVEPKNNSSQLLYGSKRQSRQSALNILKDTGTTNILMEDIEENSEVEQKTSRLNTRKSTLNTTSRRTRNVASKGDSATTSDESEARKETEANNIRQPKGRRGKQAAKNKVINEAKLPENNIKEAICEEINPTAVVSESRRSRSAVTKSTVNSDISLNKTTRMASRSTGRKTINERISESETSVSPKKVTSTEEDDVHLDIHAPVTKPSKSVSRRKTMLPNLNEAALSTDIIPGASAHGRSKRKTISGVQDLASVAPSKRLKTSSNKKFDPIVEDEDVTGADNHLEMNEEDYSEWIVLKTVDGKTPTSPAIYEVKVWRAKKPAYIGFCDSLRQRLTLHKLKQNSGNKHLDKFIERNYDDIQIRYEVVPSVNDAKVEVKNRINNFVAQYKTTPAYN